MSVAERVAGTCVALARADALAGVLLRGPSGAGKSDLALRLIDSGAVLIADDQVSIAVEDGACMGRAPEAICGLIEVRGLGVVAVPSAREAPIVLVVDLVPATEVPRLPEPDFAVIGGAHLPRLVLNPFESSAAAKIRLAVQALNGERRAGVTFPFA